MAADLIVLDGSTFFVSRASGDLEPGDTADGFFREDMRHLCAWQLLVEGEPIRVLTSRTVDYYSAAIFGTLGSARVGENPPISIRRDRFIAGGVHEDLTIENHSEQERSLRVEVRFAADFADLFEVKARARKRGQSSTELSRNRVTLRYRHDGFERGTVITFGESFSLSTEGGHTELRLPPRGRWHTCIEVATIIDGKEQGLSHRDCQFRQRNLQPDLPVSFEQWMQAAPVLETDSDVLQHTYQQSLVDLAALRFRPIPNLSWSLPAAGLPWFMALFGRDSIIAAYQALPFQPHLARTTLEALAALQAKDFDDYRDAEPGKILHELRRGELTALGEVPHSPYYGTHDATPLFLILLDEYERWTGDLDFVRGSKPAALAALAWIERHGDPDGDGYLEYRTRSLKGLKNQGWKDSWNSVLFADGRLAEPPIALCEIQGYAYDARIRLARLARRAWDDEALARRLERDAAALQQRFNRDFWNEERSHYVLGLDGHKQQVDSMASNMGHLLWSGIVPKERAAQVVDRLMAPDMFSGWGVRTMSAKDYGYNPIEYHNGTVWPHDCSLIAEGMRRYGFRTEASRLAVALIDAAAAFAYRLPEVFAGFSREDTGMPVEYPTASRPQAWAAGAPLLGLRTLLGLDAVDGQLRSDPHLPDGLGRLRLRGVPVARRPEDAP